MKKNILAIDPGVSGGYCYNIGENVHLAKFTDMDAVRENIGGIKFHATFLEKVHSSPQMGVKSAFTFGENFGMWKEFLSSQELHLVSPQVWQRDYPQLVGTEGNVRKKLLKSIAVDRTEIGWNGIPPRDLKLTMATCDAFLIWAYGMLKQYES